MALSNGSVLIAGKNASSNVMLSGNVCPESVNIVFTRYHIALLVIAILAVALNGFVLYAFVAWLRKCTPSCWILMSLAMSDLFTGLFEAPLQLVTSLRVLPYCRYEALFAFSEFLHTLTVHSSTFNICTVTIDRYLMVCFPIKHTVFITEKGTKVTLCIIWTISVVISAVPFSFRGNREVDSIYYTFAMISFFFVPLILMTLLFPIMVKRIYLWSKSRNRLRHRLAAEYKAAVLFLIMYLIFVFSTAPMQVMKLLINWNFHFEGITPTLLEALVCLRFAASVMNPAIYTLRTTAFMNAMQAMLGSVQLAARGSRRSTLTRHRRQRSCSSNSGRTIKMSLLMDTRKRNGTIVADFHNDNLPPIEGADL